VLERGHIEPALKDDLPDLDLATFHNRAGQRRREFGGANMTACAIALEKLGGSILELWLRRKLPSAAARNEKTKRYDQQGARSRGAPKKPGCFRYLAVADQARSPSAPVDASVLTPTQLRDAGTGTRKAAAPLLTAGESRIGE